MSLCLTLTLNSCRTSFFEAKKRSGFSLVELSIVLVILGLLVGGILVGQSLIRAAELRSAITQYQRYHAAIHAFRDKYFQLPGDFNAATKFWLRQSATNCVTNSGAATNSAGACDGDGDGRITGGGVASGANEQFQFWRHLTLAGLIEGSYTGQSGATVAGDGVAGSNMPQSRVASIAGWNASTWNMGAANHPNWSNGDYGNALTLAGNYPGTTPYYRIIKPEEAWNIDAKLDDGRPQQGKIWAIHWDECSTAATAASTNGEYALDVVQNWCALVFLRAY